MPVKTKSGKWRWGNVERNTKKELAQTVWGIWKKNGSKGDFGEFFKTGKVNEGDFQLNFKQIGFPDREIPALRFREKKNLPIYTTRVAQDFLKFGKGDIVITPWQSLYVITDETIINDVGGHPFFEELTPELVKFFEELTPEQVKFLSEFDMMKILKLERVGDDIENQVAQTEIRNLFDETVRAFNEKFGIDLSYMRLNVSPVPHYTDGRPSDLPFEEFAGSWLENSSIEICPDMDVPMRTFGVADMSKADFTQWIIAHELAHEVWNRMPERKDFIDAVLSTAKNENFSTAYLKTVGLEKYEQELFCEYIAKLIAGNNDSVEFKLVKKTDLMALLDEIDAYNENPRYSRSQFEKYLGSIKGIDRNAIYYGMFRNGRCEALSYLNKTPGDFTLIAQITSFIKGSGRPLIENIMSRSPDMWLAADPLTDDPRRLLSYYRQFGLKEYVIERCRWVNGMTEHVFYKTSTPENENMILQYFKSHCT